MIEGDSECCYSKEGVDSEHWSAMGELRDGDGNGDEDEEGGRDKAQTANDVKEEAAGEEVDGEEERDWDPMTTILGYTSQGED